MLSNWAENVGSAARSTVCSALSTSENLASFLDAIFPNGTWDNQIASGIRRGFCSDPTDAPNPSDFAPFQGGQCTTLYRVEYTNPQGFNLAINDLTGPLGFETEQVFRGFCPDPFTQYFITFNDGATRQSLGDDQQGTTCNKTGMAAVINSVIRQDGQPDNCGSPPPDIPPYSPITINNNVTYIDSSSQQVTENYDFTVNAPVIIGGILIAPVTVAGNNFTVELGLTINGGVDFNFGNGGNTDTQTGSEPPINPIPEPPGNETENRIIAVLVTASVNQSDFTGTIIFQQGNPDIYVPRLGSVSFYVAAGPAAGWTSDIDVKNLRSYIRCPVPQGAINVAATPQPGVTFTLTKVFASQEQYRKDIGA